MYDRAKQMLMLETDRPHVLREIFYVCRPAGTVSMPGVYGGLLDKIPMGMFMNKGLTMRTGQTHVNRWTDDLLHRIEEGQIDPFSSSLTKSPSMMVRECTRLSVTKRTAASRCAQTVKGVNIMAYRQSSPANGSAMALARGLGWFSIGLGLAEMLAPPEKISPRRATCALRRHCGRSPSNRPRSARPWSIREFDAPLSNPPCRPPLPFGRVLPIVRGSCRELPARRYSGTVICSVSKVCRPKT